MTFEEFRAEYESLHNDLCIVGDIQVQRLVGVARDPHEFYYVVRDYRGKQTWVSSVASCVSIKPWYQWYSNVDEMFVINGGTKTDEFLILGE